MPQLPNAARRVPKATYVPLQIASTSVGSTTQHPDGSDTTQPNAAILKFGYIRQLNLQGGDVAKAMAVMQTTTATDLPSGINATDIPSILSQFEGSPMPSLLPEPAQLAALSVSSLLAFGKALSTVRKGALDLVSSTGLQATQMVARADTATPIATGMASHLLQTAVAATKNFQANASAVRVGMLNLERLEMTPAGLERGELIATICLAPLEQTSVVQKEWSVTNQEFTSIVTTLSKITVRLA